MEKPAKLGITGTHSTGKSTLLTKVSVELEQHGLKVGRVMDLARRARDLGFPILAEHTFESTLWIIAECMRQEAEASLNCDVILVDRPVPDALGYLLAGLELSGRTIPEKRLNGIRSIARAHTDDYDLIVATTLDENVELGEGRDTNAPFRAAVDRQIASLIAEFRPDALRLTFHNSDEIAAEVVARLLRSRT